MRRQFRLLSASLLVGIIATASAFPALAQYNYNNSYSSGYSTPTYNQPAQNYSLPPLQGRVVSAPAGTTVPAMTTYTISSMTSRVGDRVAVTLGSGLAGNGGMVLPAGTVVEGQVVEVSKANRFFSRSGRLNIRFNTAITPDGRRVPISAKIATQDGTGVLTAGTTATRLKETAISGALGAGTGAVLGTALGGITGSTGKGAIYGTAIGSGLGLVAGKGKDVELPSNAKVDIVLDQPLTVGADAGYNY